MALLEALSIYWTFVCSIHNGFNMFQNYFSVAFIEYFSGLKHLRSAVYDEELYGQKEEVKKVRLSTHNLCFSSKLQK